MRFKARKDTLALAVVVAVALGGVMAATSAVAQGTASDRQCTVTVDRRPELAGVYDVTRQEMANGDCICYVYTGPQPQSDMIEGSIAALQQSGDCRDAKPGAYVPGSSVSDGALTAGGAAVLLAATTAGGIAAAVSGGSDGGGGSADSPGG